MMEPWDFPTIEINFFAIMLEQMHKVMTWKSAKHGIPYGYLLNHVFKHFEMPLGRGVLGTVKQIITVVTLLECECVEGKTKGRSQVSDLLEQQASFKRELTDLTVLLNDKEEVEKLRAENEQLLKTNASLSEEVQDLNKQIIQAHVDANERMTLLKRSLTTPPPPS
ncbi:hypothetical protein KY284_013243 [Solanum tuberosum]|nr:hypothetical protein KY284_013243 [Solanum tuberosum]